MKISGGRGEAFKKSLEAILSASESVTFSRWRRRGRRDAKTGHTSFYPPSPSPSSPAAADRNQRLHIQRARLPARSLAEQIVEQKKPFSVRK